ncbi:hypothetical protein [Qipengyuania sp. NPDC077563]|uniref:hypothetical protein n=1 Tax=Qipengyuania sp. NPDC077563 TaxID=3364497 RepID=UPI00384F722A
MGDDLEDSGITDRAWFRPAVAVWFALLLGAGLWFMPPRVHDSLASLLGLDRMLPLFAAPIGAAGTAILCAALALFGGMLGWALAARLGRPARQKVLTSDAGPVDNARLGSPEEETMEPRRRRVLSAREDIDEEGIPPSIDAPEEFHAETEAAPAEPEQAEPEEEDFELVEAVIEQDEEPSFDAPIIQSDPEEELDTSENVPEFEAEAEEWVADAEQFHEFEVQPEEEAAPFEAAEQVEYAEPEDAQEAEPLGDMSLDSLLARLEGALDTRRQTVERSERAARQPALQPVPLPNAPIQNEALQRMASDAQSAEDDPMVAFLQREANRRLSKPDQVPDAGTGDTAEPPSRERTPSAAHSAVSKMLDRMGLSNRHD